MLTEFLLKQSVGSYNPMMAFGYFVFNLYTTPYQTQQHDKEWRHPSNSRVGARPSYQFVGVDEEAMTLSGVLMPEITGGRISLELLEKWATSARLIHSLKELASFMACISSAAYQRPKLSFSMTVQPDELNSAPSSPA